MQRALSMPTQRDDVDGTDVETRISALRARLAQSKGARRGPMNQGRRSAQDSAAPQRPPKRAPRATPRACSIVPPLAERDVSPRERFLVDIPAPAPWNGSGTASWTASSNTTPGGDAPRGAIPLLRRAKRSAADATPSLAAAVAACAIFSTPFWAGGWTGGWTEGSGETAKVSAAAIAKGARAGAQDVSSVTGEIATATIDASAGATEGLHLTGDALRQLLAERPVKCVLSRVAADGLAQANDGAGPDQSGLGCVETVAYRPSAALFTRYTPAATGGRVEVNAAYSIEGDALCHHTAGLSVLVIGDARPPLPPAPVSNAASKVRLDADTPAALSLEALLEARYAAHEGAPICHRLTQLGSSPYGPLFRADAVRAGALDTSRSDPRPFVMRRAAL